MNVFYTISNMLEITFELKVVPETKIFFLQGRSTKETVSNLYLKSRYLQLQATVIL